MYLSWPSHRELWKKGIQSGEAAGDIGVLIQEVIRALFPADKNGLVLPIFHYREAPGKNGVHKTFYLERSRN